MGLAEAVKREEGAREREREKKREPERDGNSGREKREREAVGSSFFFLRI